MILVDANVFMYAAGRPSPQRDPCRRYLRSFVKRRIRAQVCTDTEVLQELLHRYRSIHEPELALMLFDKVLSLGMRVLDVTEGGMREARAVVEMHPHLSTRDAVHLGVMGAHGVQRILTYDRAFDTVPGIRREEP